MLSEAYEIKKRREALRVRLPGARDRITQWQANHPDKTRRYKLAWVDRNREKRAAHVIVGNAIRDGRLIRKPCEICGAEKVTAHHPDYSKPLTVKWLCSKHHGELHRKYR